MIAYSDAQPGKLIDFALQMLCAGVEWLREERPDLVIPVLTHMLKQEVQECVSPCCNDEIVE